MKRCALAFGFLILIYSCETQRKKIDDNSSTRRAIKRPSISDEEAKKLVKKHDYAVATLMQSISDFEELMDKGAKITSVVENNLTDLFNEAKQAEAAITDDVKDKLNEDDYGVFSRNTRRLKEQETELEGIKQLK